MTAVEVRGLVKDYPAHRRARDMLLHPFRQPLLRVLDGVDLEVGQGEIVGVLGPNGAGKTTLLKLVGALLEPSAGSVSVQGWDTRRQGDKVRRVASYCFSEERSFYWRLTGLQNLTFFAALHDLHGKDARVRIDELAGRLGIERYLERPFGHYSSGIRQRFSLARALLAQPRVLLLDEPTRGIDPAESASIWEFVRDELAGGQGVSVILVTHQVEEAAAVCDRVVLLDGGRITDELRAAELSGLTKGLQTISVRVSGLTPCDVPGLRSLRGVRNIVYRDGGVTQTLDVWCEDGDLALQSLLSVAAERGLRVLGFERHVCSSESLATVLRGGRPRAREDAGLPSA